MWMRTRTRTYSIKNSLEKERSIYNNTLRKKRFNLSTLLLIYLLNI